MTLSRCCCRLLLLSLSFVSFIISVTEASFATTLDPGTEECFIIRTPSKRDTIISGNYDCLDDDCDGESLIVRIMNIDNGKNVYEKPSSAVSEDSFTLSGNDIITTNTRYGLCFKNNNQDENDSDNLMNIGFNIRVKFPPRTLENDESGPDAQRALELIKKATLILQDWESLKDHFDFLRNREAVHKIMSDNILTRIQRWTLIEAILVMGMATGQVLYWKKFFETRRYL